MNKHKYIWTSVILALLIVISVLPGCSEPTPETITLTSTERITDTITTTLSIPTTVTVTHPTTITVTPAIITTDTTIASTTSSATTSTDPYSHYRGYLLDGYPEDIWPLYGKLAIDSCSFDIMFPAYNNTGHFTNTYNVVYVTDKTQKEIAEYYTALLDTNEESSFWDAKGTVNGYEVDARWDYWSGENIVYLSVLLPNTLNITSNPFHTDFPESLLNLYELDDMWSERYICTSNPPTGTIISSKLFSHTGTYDAAIDYYRALYSETQDYEETVTEEYSGPSTQLRGIIDDMTFTIIIGVWGNPAMIQVNYQTAS